MAENPAVKVRVDLLAELAGENVAVTPAGTFDAAKLTAAENPLDGVTVMESLALEPRPTLTFALAGDRLKVAPAVITSGSVSVVVTPPPLPVMVSG